MIHQVGGVSEISIITSPTSGGRSVSIVRSWTQATGYSLVYERNRKDVLYIYIYIYIYISNVYKYQLTLSSPHDLPYFLQGIVYERNGKDVIYIYIYIYKRVCVYIYIYIYINKQCV
jgi:hypothetical protein